MTSAHGFIRHFHACNRRDMSKFAPFYVGMDQYGWVEKNLSSQLLGETDFFRPHGEGLALHPHFYNFTTRSEALAKASQWIAERNGKALRKEMYPVLAEWGDEPVAELDRAAVPWFGIHGCGIHVNGFTRKLDGIHIWIGERAMDRQVDPGKLDNLIGGGQPIGLTLEENVAKEAKEEAGIDAKLAATAERVRKLHYMLERPEGLRNDTLFIYDLELPPNYVPKNTDGEVAAFHLMSLPEVAKIVRETDRFKFNCNLVVIDFLMRHGFITTSDPEYDGINSFLLR